MKYLFFLCIPLLLLVACTQPYQRQLFSLQENTGINFTNTVQNSKDFNIFSYRNFYNGGGAAIGDINNDGLADVLFTANMGSNKLYLNKGNWVFEDITDKAGVGFDKDWSTGVELVDINHDGWLDIYLCNAGYINGQAPENKLLINNHKLGFTDSAAAYNLTNKGGYCTHAAFVDYDLDGDLDCYLLNNSFIPVNTLNYANKRELRAEDWPVADFLKGGGDKLMRNDSGRFTDVSKAAGIYGSLIGFGLGVTVGDVNGDHYPDLYISNDFFERDYLYINKGDGTFSEELEKRIQHTSHSSMGADMADLNNDGYPEIFTTEMLPGDDYRLKTTTSFENVDVQRLKVKSGFGHQFMQNSLQINNRNGKFMEGAFFSGVSATDWSWGGLIFDADNDGQSDIFVCNGIYNDVTDQDFIDFFANDVVQKMVMTGKKDEIEDVIAKMPSRPVPNYIFRNKGDYQFADMTREWGMGEPSFSNGAAYGDLDNDGDLDLIVNNVNQPAFVYRNNSREQADTSMPANYIGVSLQGTGDNSFAIGSTVKVFLPDQIISRELIPSRGFQSSMDYKMIIGLGKSKRIDSLQVIWPDRTTTSLIRPSSNTVLTIARATNMYRPWMAALPPTTTPMLIADSSTGFDKHTEDDFVDFYYERNVPVMRSHEGPKVAIADVNGDGRSDLYIGGAAGQEGQLYLATIGSGYQKSKQQVFAKFAAFEDVATVFFDADKDGDADLYIGAGGNRFKPRSRELQHRLYLNDGQGNFMIDPAAFTEINDADIAIALPHDVDGDGDTDLFLGSGNTPYQYGITPRSYLFINDGKGHFRDEANNRYKAIASLGLVKAGAWADVDGDHKAELLVTGEWMSPTILKFTEKGIITLSTGLEKKQGWWRSILAQDLDGDGDVDLVLGNVGPNFYLRPDSAHPVKLWINDYDNNGDADKILSYTIGGKDMPVFLRRELSDQIPSLKKENLKHADFANKSVPDLFSKEAIQQSTIKQFDYNLSVVALNDGKGHFTLQPLPTLVQLSSVNAIVSTDLNGDQLPDLILGGNWFNFLPQFCRIDGSYGHVLLNKGNGRFEWVYPSVSGLCFPGQVSDMKVVEQEGKMKLLILRNDDYPLYYTLPDLR
jgi:enediyne biosynthesis protein E4